MLKQLEKINKIRATHDEAVQIVHDNVPVECYVVSSVETDEVYEFHVVLAGSLDNDSFTNSFYCSVDKETGDVEESAVLLYAQLFEPERCKELLKTMKKIEDILS